MGSWSRSCTQAELESKCGTTACQLCVLNLSLLIFKLGTQLHLFVGWGSRLSGPAQEKGLKPGLVGDTSPKSKLFPLPPRFSSPLLHLLLAGIESGVGGWLPSPGTLTPMASEVSGLSVFRSKKLCT